MKYKLPIELRKELGTPQGKHFIGGPERAIPEALKWMQKLGLNIGEVPDLTKSTIHKIICVGDIVTKAVLEHPELNKFVKMCFIDGNTQRGAEVLITKETIPVEDKSKIREETIENPREYITDGVFVYIKARINDPYQYIVNVIGEEDLIVLPATLESENDFIFYGQPPITAANPPIEPGAVVIYSDPQTKTRFQHIFDQFLKES